MTSRLSIRLLPILCALSFAGCQDGTDFTVKAAFPAVVQRLREQLTTVPSATNLQIPHTYTDHVGIGYLDHGDDGSIHRVIILVRKRTEYETEVTIHCEEALPRTSSGGKRLPDLEQHLQQTLFPAL